MKIFNAQSSKTFLSADITPEVEDSAANTTTTMKMLYKLPSGAYETETDFMLRLGSFPYDTSLGLCKYGRIQNSAGTRPFRQRDIRPEEREDTIPGPLLLGVSHLLALKSAEMFVLFSELLHTIKTCEILYCR